MKETSPLETVKQVVDMCITSVHALCQLKNVVYLQQLRDETRQMELIFYPESEEEFGDSEYAVTFLSGGRNRVNQWTRQGCKRIQCTVLILTRP